MLSRGFTLIELLVVISIISLLSSVTLNSLSNARQKAYDSKVEQTLISVSQALTLYDFNNNFLPKENLNWNDSGASDFYRIGTCQGAMSGLNVAVDISTDLSPYLNADNLNLRNGCILYINPLHALAVNTITDCENVTNVRGEFCDYRYLILHLPGSFGTVYEGALSESCVMPKTTLPSHYSKLGYICKSQVK